jgi:hypothetical protein
VFLFNRFSEPGTASAGIYSERIQKTEGDHRKKITFTIYKGITMLKENWMKYGAIYVLVVMIMLVLFYYILDISLTMQNGFEFWFNDPLYGVGNLKRAVAKRGIFKLWRVLKNKFFDGIDGDLGFNPSFDDPINGRPGT